MRKLTEIEQAMLKGLNMLGHVRIEDDMDGVQRTLMLNTLDSLVKKKRAAVRHTDAGPDYTPLAEF